MLKTTTNKQQKTLYFKTDLLLFYPFQIITYINCVEDLVLTEKNNNEFFLWNNNEEVEH